MKRQLKITLLLTVLVLSIIGCKSDETPPKEPTVLLSVIKTEGYEGKFLYDETGKLISIQINETNYQDNSKYEKDLYTFSYLPDGRIDLITAKTIGRKGQFKFTWKSQTEASIDGQSLFDGSFKATLTTDAKGKPLDLIRNSGYGLFFSDHYTYKYDTKGNYIELDPNEPVSSVNGKIYTITEFDTKESPFASNFIPITLINAFEVISNNYFYSIPFGAVNNGLQQTQGFNRSWKFNYQYNEANYPISLDAQYTSTSTNPIKILKRSFTFEYITK